MSSINALSAGMAAPALAPPKSKSGKPDGDGDHGVEPAPSAQAQAAGGSTGSSGALNKIA